MELITHVDCDERSLKRGVAHPDVAVQLGTEERS
jgi:hypothetical protein